MYFATAIFCTFIIATRSLPGPYAVSKSQELTQSRIVNGYEIDITEAPYQASLRRQTAAGWSHLCGAAIIGTNTLLTAAHCVSTYQTIPTSLKVIVGTSYRLSSGTSYDPKIIIIHESYSPYTLENDIALIVIYNTMTFSNTIKAITIAPENYNLTIGTEAVVTGFGTVSYQGSASPILLAAKVKIVDQGSCIRAYLSMASVTNRMVCASETNPPRDACQGDSGGPLVANNILIGIVSWGENCADPNYPGVYTRVSEYASWVETCVKQYS